MNSAFNHGDTETRRQLLHEELTQQIIGAASEVHKTIGPGLLGSAYEECLCHELHLHGIEFARQVSLPVQYKGVNLDCGYRMDLVVGGSVILEMYRTHLARSRSATPDLFKDDRKTSRPDIQFSRGDADPRWNCSKGDLVVSVPL